MAVKAAKVRNLGNAHFAQPRFQPYSNSFVGFVITDFFPHGSWLKETSGHRLPPLVNTPRRRSSGS
jgi:hypothetical protein